MALGTSAWLMWWHHADWVVRSVFLVLVSLSCLSWAVMGFKAWQFLRWERLEAYWRRHLDQVEDLHTWRPMELPPDQPSYRLLGLIEEELRRVRSGHFDRQAAGERQAQTLREVRLHMEDGLAFLATVGSSSPFIGLFGTVWGIMHALQVLGGGKAPSLDLIAGPVAEALAATAAGLFAAIPALFGYNFLIRHLRRLNSEVDGNALRILDRIADSTDERG